MLRITPAIPLSLLALSLLAGSALASYEYRFIEAESCVAQNGGGLREEGFTSWMGHPSGAKVMVLGAEGHYLEYEVQGLRDAEYHVYVRGLAWATGCAVDVTWDGEAVGQTKYARPGTALKWSQRVGVVRGGGKHTLRLVGAEGIHQAPYLDVVLLTTQPDYRPPDDDRDFVSYVTSLPVLKLGDGSVAPEPGSASDAPGLRVTQVSTERWTVGSNPLRVSLVSDTGPRTVRLEGWMDEEQPHAETARLAAGEAQTVDLPVTVSRAGKGVLNLRATQDERVLLAGSYLVSAPDPFSTRLNEYAYDDAVPQAIWTAKATLDPALLDSVGVSLTLLREGEGAPLARHTPALGPEMSQALEIGDLPRGRYEVRASFSLNGLEMAQHTNRFIIHQPFAVDAWEPVERSSVQGDRVLVNGKPFLGRMLFHAGANEAARSRGYNMVQCWGGDPNPIESIGKHLDACLEAGMYGAVALFNNRYFLPGEEFDLEHLREAVLRYRNHPALLMWDLVDEPDVHMTPEAVEAGAKLVRELDPNHFVWVNLCRPDRATDFLASQDLWSFDVYPIPSQGLVGYLRWLGISDESLRGRKPLGTCLQTYQWDVSRLRMPNPDELRASAYLHLIHGYTWFGYYSYNDPEPSGCLARDPELWSYTRALNGELAAFAPVILSEGDFSAVETDLDATVCRAATKQHQGRTYLVAVNLTGEPLTVRLRVTGQDAELMFEEDRVIPVRDGVLEDLLRPSAARVYLVR